MLILIFLIFLLKLFSKSRGFFNFAKSLLYPNWFSLWRKKKLFPRSLRENAFTPQSWFGLWAWANQKKKLTKNYIYLCLFGKLTFPSDPYSIMSLAKLSHGLLRKKTLTFVCRGAGGIFSLCFCLFCIN